jgi:GTPase SAR1 family protein
VTALHYRNAKGTIIVYDVTNRQSFENVERWLKDTCQLASQDCQIMILGNKTDVDRFSANSRRQMSRQVSLEEGLALAERNKVIFYEVSAVENTNIAEAINVMANQIVDAHLAEKLRRSMQSSRDDSEYQHERTEEAKIKMQPRSRFECCVQSGRHDDLGGGGGRRCC